jgi:zinc transporter ZupT
MRDRTLPLWIQCALLLGGVVGVSAMASAHGASTATVFGVSVSFSVVLGASATIGSLGGVAALAFRSRETDPWFGDSWCIGVVGLALVSLAVLLAYPGLRARPLVSVGGILIGGIAGLALSASIDNQSIVAEANVAFGVLAIHHVLEGVALAATYATGSRIGLVAAAILTLHTIVETAVVGGVYTAADRVSRGLLAILVMQVGYVGAAVGALTMTVSISSTEGIVPAITSGVLLYIGVRHASMITPGVPDFH